MRPRTQDLACHLVGQVAQHEDPVIKKRIISISQLPTFVVVALLVIVGCEQAVSLPAGVTAPNPPRQKKLTEAPVFVRGDFIIRPVASFELDARVLASERYRFDRSADVSPIDLALGWGPMSNQEVIDQIKITQSRRFYWWRVKRYPIPRRQIIENSANMHMVPANDEVRDQLYSLRRGELVSISGYLANVTAGDFTWRTSTTRSDAGAGACEIVWVESVEVREL